MRIAIDATTLLLRSAGVKNYFHYWLLALLSNAAARGDIITTYPINVPVPPMPNHEHSVSGPLGTAIRLGLVHLVNSRGGYRLSDVLLRGIDRIHASQHMATRPLRKKVSATIFDLSCWTTPQYHTPANVAATRRYAERILKTADGLIAISAHARDDASEILRIPPERISVIYPGVASSFFSAKAQDAERVWAKYRLVTPYILFVGCIEPRKNISGLIRAYQQLPTPFRRNVRLLVVGPFGWADDGVRQMLSCNEGIQYLGYVPEADLPGLVRGAKMLVYPSFYEGFGLPVAQAMAAGIPVIGSNRSSLPEVIGEAGICVNPDSTEEISAAIQQILTSSDFAHRLGVCGRRRAELFRWEICAGQSLELFHCI